MYIARKKPCKWRRLTKPKGSIESICYKLMTNYYCNKPPTQPKLHFRKRNVTYLPEWFMRLNKEIGLISKETY
jgi:hypothetical protein